MTLNNTLNRNLSTLAIFVVAIVSLSCGAVAKENDGQASVSKAVDLFVSGKNGHHTYRIPALVVTNSGKLLAFCEGRKSSKSDSEDINLLLRRSEDGGKTWTDQQVIWDDEKNTCGNPCPIIDRETGKVWLLMCWNDGRDTAEGMRNLTSKDTRRVFVTSSDDDGVTWAEPKEITSDVKLKNWTWYATGPGNGIQLTRGPHKGRLVAPCDHIEAGRQKAYSHVIYSDDHGKTWKIGGRGPLGTNESAVVELADGRLMLNMRNYIPWRRLEEPRRVCFSDDGGLTWRDSYQDKTLIEPVCQASMLRYTWPENSKDGKSRILFCNPASKWRVKLTVRMSSDEGKTWHVSQVLNPKHSGYSSLAAMPDGEILCLFENGQKTYYEKISLARFRLE